MRQECVCSLLLYHKNGSLPATIVHEERIMTRKTLQGGLFIILMILAVTGCTAARNSTSASDYFEHVKDNPVKLRILLADMPKGGDIHNHLSGMIYAEDFLKMAARSDMCLDPANEYTVSGGPCDKGKVRAQDALRNATHWNGAINAWSTRQDRRDSRMWGHDQFFATFFRFGAAGNDKGYMLAEAARQANRENVQYLELMLSVFPKDLSTLAEKAKQDVARGDFTAAYKKLTTAGLINEARMAEGRKVFTDAEKRRDLLLKGGPGSEVHMRYVNHSIRTMPLHVVFAQLIYSFALDAQDPRVVGINLVAAEDNPVSMQDYEKHMNMIDFLHKKYNGHKRTVNIALHAGELTLGVVEPEGLTNHIRLAIEKGHAQRIGHGIDIVYEEKPYELLKTMREKKIAIEIQLTSNDVILHVSGDDHPLKLYMEEGVPFALGSDDMGVARTDLTREYMRAVQDQGLGYDDLKASVYNSLEYSFLPGQSYWADYDKKIPMSQCAGKNWDSQGCRDFLNSNVKANVQRAFELKWDEFETRWSGKLY